MFNLMEEMNSDPSGEAHKEEAQRESAGLGALSNYTIR